MLPERAWKPRMHPHATLPRAALPLPVLSAILCNKPAGVSEAPAGSVICSSTSSAQVGVVGTPRDS